MSPRTIAALLFAAGVVVSGGCSSDSSTGPSAGPAGVYSLREIDGTASPVQVVRGAVFIPDDNRHSTDFVATIVGGRRALGASSDARGTIGYSRKKAGVTETGFR